MKKINKQRAKTSPLLKVEGKVDTHGKLTKSNVPGSGVASHHMPNNNYMKSRGVSRNDGIAMNVEHPLNKKGGRHREIHKKLPKQDTSKKPRDALAESVKKTREAYKENGVYTPEMRESFKKVIKENKKKFPDIFKK